MPPSAWALAAFVVLLTGISKAGFGGALGGVSVPLLALVVPAPVAAGILLPVLYAIDWLGIGVYWKQFSREEMKILLPGAGVGVVLGSLSLGLLDPLWVQLIVGMIAIGLGLYRLRGRRASTGAAGPGAARFWSAVAGYTSALAHAGGPPLFAYLSNRRLDPTRFVATASCFFFIVNLMNERTAQDDRYSSSIVALDASNGQERWVFQTGRHDLWDYDLPAQPTLLDLKDAQGQVQPALAEVTKAGQIFLLNRATGQPISRVENLPVPQGKADGERYAATQPRSTGLPQVGTETLTESDMWGPRCLISCPAAFSSRACGTTACSPRRVRTRRCSGRAHWVA